MTKNKSMIFAMPNSKELGKMIAKRMKINLSEIKRLEFADGEILVQSLETARNKDVFIVASTSPPVNTNLMELLIFVDSLKRGSANSITVVLTYFGYARMDRKAAGRQPITAKLVANMLETAGVTKVIVIDVHNPSIQGFFNIPVDDLRGQYILAPAIRKIDKKFTVVSPDHGGATRARILAELISDNVDIAIVDKRRTGKNESVTMGVLGNVKNRNIVIIDDMIDTGGTIIKAAKILREKGAKKIVVAATHGIFSYGFEAFSKSKDIDKVIVTDSISDVKRIKDKKLEVISLGDLLGDAIESTIESKSFSLIYSTLRKKIAKI